MQRFDEAERALQTSLTTAKIESDFAQQLVRSNISLQQENAQLKHRLDAHRRYESASSARTNQTAHRSETLLAEIRDLLKVQMTQ